mgnify:CR=1 FL=1
MGKPFVRKTKIEKLSPSQRRTRRHWQRKNGPAALRRAERRLSLQPATPRDPAAFPPGSGEVQTMATPPAPALAGGATA